MIWPLANDKILRIGRIQFLATNQRSAKASLLQAQQRYAS
jgi:hypothetical protein